MDKSENGFFTRNTFVKAHALLAVFVLPVAILFTITGAFYIWGIKGGYDVADHEIQLREPLRDELAGLVALAREELAERGMDEPTGKAKIKRVGSSYQLEWTGSDMDIILEPTNRPTVAKLKIKKASWYRQFVQLHKAKGGLPFKVFATAFAIILLLVLIVGFIMAWQIYELRKLVLISIVMGFLTLVVMVMTS